MTLAIGNNPLSLYFRSCEDYAPTARPMIKVKLAPVGKMPEGAAARAIVDDWTDMREGSRNLTKAIMLYQSLREGDPSVLLEEFPWIASLMTPATLPANQPATRPSLSSRVADLAPPVIIEDTDDETLQANSCAQVADFLGDFDL